MKIKNENKSKFNLVDYIIKLNKECNFKSAMYIERLFTNAKIQNNFEIKDKKKHCMQVLQNFDDLFWNTNSTFEKGEEFTYRYISECYLNSNKEIEYFIERPEHHKNESRYEKDISTLCWRFFVGLEKFRYFYLIYYKNCKIHIKLSNKNKDEIFKILLKKLPNEDILNIYKIFNYTFYRTTTMIVKNEEMIDIIKNIIINLKKIPEITIFKNEVTTDNKKIIARFLNDMDNYKLKFNNMKICQISNHVEIKKVAILKLLEIKLKYKSNEFFVRIDQESLKLYANIYKNEKRIMKDRLFRIEDFERIFLCIIDSIDVLDEVYNSNIKD